MSIKQQMQSKAAAMVEAMAERARTPQDIEALRQRVLAQVQGGELQPYIGIPLLQDLSKRLAETKTQMAGMVAGMGTPPAQGAAPIAQQVVAEASQGAGVEALPTNLPQSYAPGGLVAFAGGGEVDRYDGGGLSYVPNDPQAVADREAMLDTLRRLKAAGMDIATLPGRGVAGAFETAVTRPLRAMGVPLPYLPDSFYGGNRSSMTPYYDQLRTADAAPVPPSAPAAPVTSVGTPPAAAPATSAAPAGIAGIPGVGAPAFKMPTLPALTERKNYYSLVEGLPDKVKSATEAAVDAEQKLLKDMTDPSFKAREDRLNKRELEGEKDSAVSRALNLMSLGFGIAGSKERTVAGALGNEGRQGIAELIRGEAAARAAKDKLDDARDAFEQQKLATAKGDRTAAQAAGQRAADNMRQGVALQVQAGHSFNTEGIQADQLRQTGVLGIAGLGLQARGQDIQAAGINANLQLGREKLQILKDQIAAGDKRAQAALMGAQQKVASAFNSSMEYRSLVADLTKRYGANFMQMPQAQMELNRARQMYIQNNLAAFLPESGGSSGARDVAELLKD